MKSGRKKGRPKTAGKYNPSRGVAAYEAGFSGSPIRGGAGVSYSPYQVPNAARIPAPNQQMQRGVSFEGGRGYGAGPTDFPNGRGSPLRNASPRRMQEMKANNASRGGPIIDGT